MIEMIRCTSETIISTCFSLHDDQEIQWPMPMLNWCPRMRRSGGERCLSGSPKRFMPRFARMERDLDALLLCGKNNSSVAWCWDDN